uniref:Uncharacterized protein n=1 Tax=Meloidogyne enterolobii TaxID=390850 RepID=A0A6V7TL86_MELEN|nr:unnamed protein product [Meloidogyne enterolobii]
MCKVIKYFYLLKKRFNFYIESIENEEHEMIRYKQVFNPVSCQFALTIHHLNSP